VNAFVSSARVTCLVNVGIVAFLDSTSFSPTEKLSQIQLAFDEINTVSSYRSVLLTVFVQFIVVFC